MARVVCGYEDAMPNARMQIKGYLVRLKLEQYPSCADTSGVTRLLSSGQRREKIRGVGFRMAKSQKDQVGQRTPVSWRSISLKKRDVVGPPGHTAIKQVGVGAFHPKGWKVVSNQNCSGDMRKVA
jgi:hypothetical protein